MEHRPDPFTFFARPPRPPLSSAVELLWFAHGRVTYGQENILPTGRAVIIFNLGDPFDLADRTTSQRLGTAWVCGPQSGYLINRPLGTTHMVGARLRPLGTRSLLRLDAEDVANRVLPLDDLWDTPTDLVRQQLADCTTAALMLDVLERELTRRLDERHAPRNLCLHALARLTGGDPPDIARLCAELEISRKHLTHLFRKQSGLTPSAIARLARFNRVLDALWADPGAELAELAQACGFYDQPHLNHDFREYTGVTPSTYVRQHHLEFKADAGAEDNRLFVPGT